MVTRLDGTQHSQTHSYSLFLHGQSQDDLGMGSLVSEIHGNILTMTLEIRSSMQTWSFNILESRQFLIDV